jgi:hypothetical protein
VRERAIYRQAIEFDTERRRRTRRLRHVEDATVHAMHPLARAMRARKTAASQGCRFDLLEMSFASVPRD